MSPGTIDDEQERHTLRVGFGTPIAPERDTSTIVYRSSYDTTASYAYCYSNCATTGYGPRGDERTDEEQKKAWRAYWQSFYAWRGTTYRGLYSQMPHYARRHSANIPCLRQLRKRAMNPVMRAHRQFMAKMSRPTGFLHSRAF